MVDGRVREFPNASDDDPASFSSSSSASPGDLVDRAAGVILTVPAYHQVVITDPSTTTDARCQRRGVELEVASFTADLDHLRWDYRCLGLAVECSLSATVRQRSSSARLTLGMYIDIYFCLGHSTATGHATGERMALFHRPP